MTATWDRAALISALQGVASGDEMALKEVYDHTSAKLLGVCLRILRAQDEAEEVLQEAYLAIWRRAGRFDSERSGPLAWMAALARSRAIDRLRTNITPLRETEPERAGPLGRPLSVPGAAEADEELHRLERRLSALEPAQALALRAAFLEGLAYDTLAQRTGAPMDRVKSSVRRALASLGASLEIANPAGDLTAAEYVLGVQPGGERAAAAARALRDRGFAAEVVQWEAALTPLTAHVAPAFPRASVWPAIAAALTPDRRSKPRGEAAAEAPPFWERLAVWRSIAAAAVLSAAAVLVAAALAPAPVARAPAPSAAPLIVSVARLEAPSSGVAFVATLDEAKGELLVIPTGEAADSGHSPQLWLIPGGAPPKPLGVFMGRRTLALHAPPGVANGSELGVSLEPLGGSPTGAPSGPMVAQGRLMRL